VILKIDPSDYQIEVQKAESALARAQADLAIEQGSQAIAREELRLLSATSKEVIAMTDLALRKPQLDQAKAAVSSAEADLHRARLDLSRAVVRAPFNALVVHQNVNLGSHINTQETLATIVSTDEYWIEAVVPLDRLAVLNINRTNRPPALVRSQAGYGHWQGHVLRATGKLSEKSRMAKVIIAIPDPIGLDSGNTSPQLMLDDYVSVEMMGRELTSVIDLPRLALRDSDTVWVFHDGSLEIRTVTLAWKQDDRVLIDTGLVSGEKVVVSDLATPVQGMRLKVMARTLNDG
jgi:RND family efflux transporter MFP subunit